MPLKHLNNLNKKLRIKHSLLAHSHYCICLFLKTNLNKTLLIPKVLKLQIKRSLLLNTFSHLPFLYKSLLIGNTIFISFKTQKDLFNFIKIQNKDKNFNILFIFTNQQIFFPNLNQKDIITQKTFLFKFYLTYVNLLNLNSSWYQPINRLHCYI